MVSLCSSQTFQHPNHHLFWLQHQKERKQTNKTVNFFSPEIDSIACLKSSNPSRQVIPSPRHRICGFRNLLGFILTSKMYHLSSLCSFLPNTVNILNIKEILILICITCGLFPQPYRSVVHFSLYLLLESLSCKRYR